MIRAYPRPAPPTHGAAISDATATARPLRGEIDEQFSEGGEVIDALLNYDRDGDAYMHAMAPHIEKLRGYL